MSDNARPSPEDLGNKRKLALSEQALIALVLGIAAGRSAGMFWAG
jgi:hypothetical protein